MIVSFVTPLNLSRYHQPADISTNTCTVAGYYDNLDDRNVVSTVEPGYLRKLLPSEAPVEGEAWTDIHKDIEGKILPGITHWYGDLIMFIFIFLFSFFSPRTKD